MGSEERWTIPASTVRRGRLPGLLVVMGLALVLGTSGAGGQEAPLAEPPSGMILLPGGTFFMGSDTEGDHAPAHRVTVDSFYLDPHEVTNAEYWEFCQATGHRLPEFWGMEARRSGPEFPNHPVVGVSWQDAVDYAAWRGKRLPTEAEWEYAARGGLAGMNYPLGETLSPLEANFGDSGIGAPVEVGSYQPNGFGLFDMAGNVFEWVQDLYGPESYSSGRDVNPVGPESGRFRVIRGGGWHSGSFCNRTYYRNALPPQWVDFAVGFRLARDADR